MKIKIQCISLLIILLFCVLLQANATEIYIFEKEPTADWIEKNLGKEFTFKIMNALKIEDKVAVLYKGKGKDFKAYFSIFEKGKEELLWKHDYSLTVTKTVLVAGYLDKDEIPDFIFCYTIEEEGETMEVWKRHLILFPNGKEMQKVEIPLSYADVVCDDLEGICQSKAGKAASIRESSVIVFPANKYGDILINMFSYFSAFETEMERKSNIKYEMIRYWIKGLNIKKEKEDGIRAFDIVGILNYKQGIYLY